MWFSLQASNKRFSNRNLSGFKKMLRGGITWGMKTTNMFIASRLADIFEIK